MKLQCDASSVSSSHVPFTMAEYLAFHLPSSTCRPGYNMSSLVLVGSGVSLMR